jgi:predicted short-subunit dehydrogenase-like oxidoreductase (DUF2520 family)
MNESPEAISLPPIAIIGPGRVGVSLALACVEAGHHVAAVGGRHAESCAVAVELINERLTHGQTPVKAVDCATASKMAELVFLTVSDTAIEPLCRELVSKNALLPESCLVHVSGCLSSQVLQPAQDKFQSRIASAHPLQTFAHPPTSLKGVHWFVQGDYQAIPVLADFINSLCGQLNVISAEDKTLYHAASVMASNYMTALIDTAIDLMQEASIPYLSANEALQPLITTVLKNVFEQGAAKALSGPISRGDVETVSRHLEAICQRDESIAEIYKVLGKRTVELALKDQRINQEAAGKLANVLER